MSADVTFDIVTASICALLIIVRCGYRILLRCKVHDTCHRMWHVDDAYMAFALLPLIGRTTCISLSFYLNPTHTYDAATEEAAAARNLSVEKLAEYYVISHKLLIPARIFYALLYVAYIYLPGSIPPHPHCCESGGLQSKAVCLTFVHC